MKYSLIRHCREAAPSFAPQARPSFAAKRRPSFFIAAFAALALCALAQSAAAAGAAFTYQGVLRAADGGALDSKTQTVKLRLYASETGGSALWGRTCNVSLDDAGLFNTELSDETGTAIPGGPTATLASVLAANAGTTLWVGLDVDGTSGEIAPRQKILPVPYAVVASDVAKASGNFAVAGRVTAKSAQVEGAVVAGSVQTSGDVSVGGNLTVSGTISGCGTVPVGGIILWNGAADDVPDGWALCNGQVKNGWTTPNLCDRFVVGAGGEYKPNATGGAKEVTLTIDQMPAHTHDYKFTGADLNGSWKDHNYFYCQKNEYSGNDNKKTTESAGGGRAHENRPPFYALCYIMRVR